MDMTRLASSPSIHFQRRWFYALWVILLAVAAGAWILWEKPASWSQASLVVQLKLRDVPLGTRIQAWNGPRAQWPGASWAGLGAFADLPLQADQTLTLPTLRVPIAERRWVRKDYIPRGTGDLVVLKVTPPGGPSRYFLLPLAEDLHSGLLKPKWKLTVFINKSFNGLTLDCRRP
jgi:hypothetical protein